MASEVINCPRCGEELTDKPKKGFFPGHKTCICEKCDYKGGLPLKTSSRIIYWCITIIVVLILIDIAMGGNGSIGILGIAAPISLYKDWQINKRLRQYWEAKKLPPIAIPKENRGVLKGVAVSGLLILLTFSLGTLLYSDEGQAEDSVVTTSEENPWQAFHSTEGKFKINFPQYPSESSSTESVENMEIPFTQYDSVDSNGDQFMAQFVIYPVEPGDLNPKGVLEGAVNGSVNSETNNKLISSSFTEYEEYPAIDFVIHNSNEELYINGRNILVNSTLYTILVASKNQNPINYNRFLNSFKLID
ncbi:hypothetical protein A2956_02460 [Candidatus Roizmanbacteria bacterium RIFCSPLOWO2_01_FULL_37_57]|nr:MAG: hypothetical protein A2956_02460 [Candidatus Roizmanbacteria bacterium RIFCSPLOWO2_01_FULL_37_57]